VFVISDLHIGDGSPKDNLCHAQRQTLLDGFLDYVEHEDGQLVIVGDFFELLRYPAEKILARRRPLLDRLARMESLYVPGNHDEAAVELVDAGRPAHPFFKRTSGAFTHTIGDKRFKFMHGHEVDPLITPRVQSLGRLLGSFSTLLEFRPGTCLMSNDHVTELLLEMGEQMLRIWHGLTAGLNKAVHECCSLVPAEQVTSMSRRIRTQRMLTRYHEDKQRGFYDVAIVGHTHKAGAFGDWYFNSGSWTGKTNNFLRISPAGHVAVFDWNHHGPQPNNTIMAA
jgi:UDP-2,3-diacylglucosamine pyrophosphatase LpxH